MLAGLFRNKKMQPWEIPALPGESPADHKERKRKTYFNDQRENNLEWFKRMDFQLDVTGMRVLDLGCGHGALSISFAERGAAEVVGIDLDDDRIDFANRNLATNFSELAERVQFRCEDVLSMTDQFDLIVTSPPYWNLETYRDADGGIEARAAGGAELLPATSCDTMREQRVPSEHSAPNDALPRRKCGGGAADMLRPLCLRHRSLCLARSSVVGFPTQTKSGCFSTNTAWYMYLGYTKNDSYITTTRKKN